MDHIDQTNPLSTQGAISWAIGHRLRNRERCQVVSGELAGGGADWVSRKVRT